MGANSEFWFLAQATGESEPDFLRNALELLRDELDSALERSDNWPSLRAVARKLRSVAYRVDRRADWLEKKA